MSVNRYLAAMILGALLVAAPAIAQTAPPANSTSHPSAAMPGGMSKSGNLVDINSASAQELDKLPGIGPARAEAIIANRPYKGKDDLAQRKIVPKNVYNQIKDKIVARQGSPMGSTGSSVPAPGTAPMMPSIPSKSR